MLSSISNIKTIVWVLAVWLLSCQQSQPENKTESKNKMIDHSIADPHSFAQPQKALTHHLELKAEINFDKNAIEGQATWHINKAATATEIVFDINGPEITEITYADGTAAPYTIGQELPFLGQPLTVSLRPTDTLLTIKYTAQNAAALQWLSAQQTAGKKHPYMYTQGQAILSRSWLPCQDSPGIRFTYNARLQVPKGLMAIMSARNPKKVNPNGIYHFEMPYPVPAYLMVVAVGNLAYTPLSSQTGIYAEPETMEAAVLEFAETQKMLEAAEKLYGKYLWEQYDLVIMPPAFPFGGMENPMVTFVTPTVLAGDKSLTSLIAHELAHSWSGNLVTNATWNDFWLNEGFTVYFERRIMELIKSPEYVEMLEVQGWQDLQHDLNELGHNNPATKLKGNLVDKNPEEVMTNIPYEKGFFFLKMIEEKIGRQGLDSLLTYYFNKYAFKSITTEKFLEVFEAYCTQHNINAPDVEVLKEWIYKPGLPATAQQPTAPRLLAVDSAVMATLQNNLPQPQTTQQWSAHEWLHFLRQLEGKANKTLLQQLDMAYNLTQSSNSELLFAWLQLGIAANYTPAIDRSALFLKQVGRNKFLVPTYKALIKNQHLPLAQKTFEQAKDGYHYVSISAISKLFNP